MWTPTIAATSTPIRTLFHTLVLRDRLIDRMALWPTKPKP